MPVLLPASRTSPPAAGCATLREMDGQGKDRASRAAGAAKPWRKRPSTILWVLSLGQLISWGLVSCGTGFDSPRHDTVEL